MDHLHATSIRPKTLQSALKMFKLSRDIRDVCNLKSVINLSLSNCYKL